MKYLFYSAIIAIFLIISPVYAETSVQKLNLILDWFVNPDHAPLFVAQEQGYFKEQGLEVHLISPADSNDPPKLLAAGQGDIIITYQPELIQQVEQGLGLMSIGSLIDKPMNCLMALNQGHIKTPADLKNKKIGTPSSGILIPMLQILLQRYGLTLQDVEIVNVRSNLVQPLLAGKIDAVTGVMRNIEAVQVEQEGYKPLLFLPEKNGVPTYSELIYAVRKSSLKDPALHQAYHHFLTALEKATAYLKKHPEECWLAFAHHYPALNNSFNHRAWYATLGYFSNHPQHFSSQEWRAFIAFMRQNKLIQSKRDLSEYYIELSA